MKPEPTGTWNCGHTMSLGRFSNGVFLQYVSRSFVKKFWLFELTSLFSHFEQSCGMPGWPEANESSEMPALLSWNLELCVQVPLPAVPE